LVLAGAVVLSGCGPNEGPSAVSSEIARASSSPPDARVVSTAETLSAALRAPTAQNIVVLPGVYDQPQPFVNDRGHRVRAAGTGVVFTAGLVVGGSAAARDSVIQGVIFDVSDLQKTFEGAAINVWGGATGARIVDVTVLGHGTLSAGLLVRQPDGLVVRGVHVEGATDYGVYVDGNGNGRPGGPAALLEDVAVTGVARPQPRSSNGTAEACLWLGATATVRHAVLRTCAWMGVWTGGATNGSVLEDLSIDDSPVGVYIEHFTTGSVFQELRIGPQVRTGVVCEWADPDWGRKPACVDDVIQDSTIDSCAIGVDLGIGTTRTSVRRVTFSSQLVAAVSDIAGVGNAYDANDYSSLADGAVSVSVGLAAIAAVTAAQSVICPAEHAASRAR